MMKKLDDHLFPRSDSHNKLFQEFDYNNDGYICVTDFVDRIKKMELFSCKDSKL